MLSRFTRVANETVRNRGFGYAGRGAMIGGFGMWEYSAARSEGHGRLYSMGRAAIWGGLGSYVPGGIFALYAAWKFAGPLSNAGWTAMRRNQSGLTSRFTPFKAEYREIERAEKERVVLQQEAMSSANRARGIFGREASLLARRYG